jgi:phospholipase C
MFAFRSGNGEKEVNMSEDPRIEHVVVLMLENESFDRTLGFLKAQNPAIDGLTGTESNPEHSTQPNSPLVQVTNTAGNSTRPDAGHDLVDVNVQLFGVDPPPPGAQPRNLGFVQNYTAQAKGNLTVGKRIMECFDPGNVPVLTALAREFAVCDQWFSSVPGPTWPNRFFVHAGTSDGIVTMTFKDYIHSYDMRTIYDSLDDQQKSWSIYYHDIPQSLALSRLRQKLSGFRKFNSFASDVAMGILPSYTFIEPRYFQFFFTRPANDQHPPHDIRLGEHLIADVYDALRSSPLWTKTLLIILYDEHGGFYDHGLPPATTNPDGKTSSDPPFDFERAGLRVPAVLVSPFIQRGTVDSTVYDHTSIPATLKRLFDLGKFLTDRDRDANTISTENWLTVARSDTPETLSLSRPPLPTNAKPSVAKPEVSQEESIIGIETGEASMEPPSDFQKSLVALAQGLEQEPILRALSFARRLDTEHDAAVEVRAQVAKFMGSGPEAMPAPPVPSPRPVGTGLLLDVILDMNEKKISEEDGLEIG